MNMPSAPDGYVRAVFQSILNALQRADVENHKRGRDIEVGVARVILTSPDGTRRALEMDNAGVITTTGPL